MAVDFASDPLAELTYYQELAVDGVFVDCPSTAREWKLATGQLSAQPTSWVGAVISGPGKPFLLPRNFMDSQTVNLWHEYPGAFTLLNMPINSRNLNLGFRYPGLLYSTAMRAGEGYGRLHHAC